MKPQYLVTLVDEEDKQLHLVWCKTLDDLNAFLMHVDKEQYVVGDIQAIGVIHEDYREFLKKDPLLEQGQKEFPFMEDLKK